MTARHRAPLRTRTRRTVAALTAAVSLAGGLVALVGATTAPVAAAPASATYTETGTEHSFTVPAGVTSLTVNLAGGSGGSASVGGGGAALITATIGVSPGDVLTATVGGIGASHPSSTGGANGGGAGGTSTSTSPGAGGGGLSAVFRAGAALLVAGGGGGAGWGGTGGPATRDAAGADGGKAGTADAGGAGGVGTATGEAGLPFQGGAGAAGPRGGGGGGGGWFGGGGGGSGATTSGGGGGGSSFVTTTATEVTNFAGSHQGNGFVRFLYDDAPAPADTTAPTCEVVARSEAPVAIQQEIEDDASGLADILVTLSQNADTVVPPFIPGTDEPVTMSSTKIDQSQPMVIEARLTDVAGNVRVCRYDDTPPPVTTLTVTVTGPGSVESSPAGIVCPPTCVAPFAEGTAVTLTPTATGGGTFEGWTGAACAGQTGPCTFTITDDTVVDATFAPAPPDASICDGPTPSTAPTGFNLIVGTERRDKLRGTDGADLIFALGGDDDISAKDGDDIVCGGGGEDKASGGDGDDALAGGAGDDKLNGNDGDDTVLGQAGDDHLKGDDGDDELDGGPGRDKLNGGDDRDLCDVTSDRRNDARNCETFRQTVP